MNCGTVIFSVSMAWLASEIVLAAFFRAKSTDIRRDEASHRPIWIVIAVSVSIGIFIGLQPFGHFAAGTVLSQIAGIALIICGIVVRELHQLGGDSPPDCRGVSPQNQSRRASAHRQLSDRVQELLRFDQTTHPVGVLTGGNAPNNRQTGVRSLDRRC